MRQFYAITTIKVANEQTRLDFYGLSISLNLAKRRLAAFTINIPPQKFLLVLDFLEFLRFDKLVVFLRRDDFEKTSTFHQGVYFILSSKNTVPSPITPHFSLLHFLLSPTHDILT